MGNNQVWGACHLPARSPPDQSYSAPPAYMNMGQMENMMPPPPPDSSKAPGYRSTSQRIVNSSIGMTLGFSLCTINNFLVYKTLILAVSLHTELLLCISSALTSFAPSIPGNPVYLHSHAGVGAPSFSRQHFSPHPWSASTSGAAQTP